MSWAKRLVVGALDAMPVRSMMERLTHDRATIFMLHRFAVPDLGVPGIAPDGLRGALEHLRKRGYDLLPLPEVFDRLAGNGKPLRRAVAFTIDDGYFDQVDVASPIFGEFDCPVTTFVCTGFVDRDLWMWWDKIEYIFELTDRRSLSVSMPGDATLAYQWNNMNDRRLAQADFTEACKRVTDDEKHRAIDALARAANVDLPTGAPERYSPLEWDALRRAEARGMRFAPHTVTHPVLSRTSNEQSEREIVESKIRLAEEAEFPEDVFCYPNGQAGDFGPREYQTLQQLGMQGAVVGSEGYGEPRDFSGLSDLRFQVSRFSFAADLDGINQCVTGFERFKALVRGGY